MLHIATLTGVSYETYLTTGEAVARLRERGLKVTRMTVQRWARTGKVPAQRLRTGGQFLFRPEDIDALLVETVARPTVGAA